MRSLPAALLLLAACSPDPSAPAGGSPAPARASAAKAPAAAAPADARERDAAAALAALGPAAPPAALREILLRHPGTAASRAAADRLRALHGAAAPTGAAPAPDPLAPRNAARAAFNAAAARAAALEAKGDPAGAAAALAAVPRDADPEVAAALDRALAALRRAAAVRQDARAAVAEAAARQELNLKVLPALAGHLLARRYPEAIRDLDDAAKRPVCAPLVDVIADERAAVAEAASFWDAFLKSLAARQGQELSIPLVDGRRADGRLQRVEGGRVHLDGPLEIPFASIHEDVLVGWTLGRAWPASDGASYVKAALFFHAEGRDDLARRYLATARELGALVDGAERIFREGLVRQLRPDPVPVPAEEPGKKPKKP